MRLLQACHCESNTSPHPAACHEEVFYGNHIKATHITTSAIFLQAFSLIIDLARIYLLKDTIYIWSGGGEVFFSFFSFFFGLVSH